MAWTCTCSMTLTDWMSMLLDSLCTLCKDSMIPVIPSYIFLDLGFAKIVLWGLTQVWVFQLVRLSKGFRSISLGRRICSKREEHRCPMWQDGFPFWDHEETLFLGFIPLPIRVGLPLGQCYCHRKTQLTVSEAQVQYGNLRSTLPLHRFCMTMGNWTDCWLRGTNVPEKSLLHIPRQDATEEGVLVNPCQWGTMPEFVHLQQNVMYWAVCGFRPYMAGNKC